MSGRGELHLSVLIETMRREGFELAVSRPQVIYREIDGVVHEPFETLTLDIEEQHQGKVMESLGDRRGELQEMQPDGKGRVRLQFRIPSRGIMGYRPIFCHKPLARASCPSPPMVLAREWQKKWVREKTAY